MHGIKPVVSVARKYQDTKEKRYKDEWYKLIKKFRNENTDYSLDKRSWTGRNSYKKTQ